MTDTVNLTMAFALLCRGCGRQIVLPRQSPLGIYSGLLYQPMAMWPSGVVCPLAGKVFVYSVEEIELTAIQMLARMTNLWEIVGVDDQETISRPLEAYAHTGGRDEQKAIRAALGWPDSISVRMKNFDF